MRMNELLNHQHCRVCDRALAYGQTTCEEPCKAEFGALQKKRRRTVLLFYAGSAVLIIVLGRQLLSGIL